MEELFSIGIDFGTLSARAVLVNVITGAEVYTSIYGYQDAVINKTLPYSTSELPPNFALQNPVDYRDATEELLKDVARNSGVTASSIISIGIDFTACTVLPVDSNMQPLCLDDRYRNNPHSWCKLWKHHAAQPEADLINHVAVQRKEHFLDYYGGSTSSEWFFAKVIEVYNNAPDVYNATYKFVEAGDWVVWLLTGSLSTNVCMAGFKSLWNDKTGYPSADFFRSLDSGLKSVLDKTVQNVRAMGSRAGGLTKRMADITGLIEGTSVAVSIIDAHAAVPVVGNVNEGSLVMTMGTSLCHILISDKEVHIKGISGVVKDGVIPGYYAYEAGQAAVGDIYEWFIQMLAPECCFELAKNNGTSPFNEMDRLAEQVRPGSNGLLALDWWNGNRSMLNNSNLSGLLIGLTLNTTPEEIYRALIESTAYGTRNIIECMETQGVKVSKVYACGGLSRKSNLVMQIFADVLGREITATPVEQTTAYGAAMYGMVAAGEKRGGYDTLENAMEHLGKKPRRVFRPNPENKEVYARFYHMYQRLSHLFGEEHKDIMLELREMKIETAQN